MLRTGKLLALIIVAFAMRLHAQAGPDEADIENPVRDKYLVILCGEPEFGSARQSLANAAFPGGARERDHAITSATVSAMLP